MKKYTRKEIASICLEELGENVDDFVLDLIVMIEDLRENAYQTGYKDAVANVIVEKNGTVVSIQNCDLYLSEIDGCVCVMVDMNGKQWFFGKHNYSFDDIISSLEKVGVIITDISEKGGVTYD